MVPQLKALGLLLMCLTMLSMQSWVDMFLLVLISWRCSLGFCSKAGARVLEVLPHRICHTISTWNEISRLMTISCYLVWILGLMMHILPRNREGPKRAVFVFIKCCWNTKRGEIGNLVCWNVLPSKCAIMSTSLNIEGDWFIDEHVSVMQGYGNQYLFCANLQRYVK